MYHEETVSPIRQAIREAYRVDETQAIDFLLNHCHFDKASLDKIQAISKQLVTCVREKRLGKGGLDAFLFEYDLSSEEGIALMCMAEALLRIPDKKTVDKLIQDKITSADWEQHLGKSASTFVNAATWALMLTGKVVNAKKTSPSNLSGVMKKLVGRGGEPFVRQGVAQAMKILGKQFVMGETIEEALKRAKNQEAKGYRYSYDMLGEAAVTNQDAERYFQAYLDAIRAIGKASNGKGPIQGPGVSVKLSALHPRYEWIKKAQVLNELVPRAKRLAIEAKQWNIGMTIDAEEADRLDLSLDVIEAVFSSPELEDWQGFGIAVQAYQKRAMYVLDWLYDLTKSYQRSMMVRLVKGAYWDSEIKHSQLAGLKDYPVFTRKNSTDVSYLACMKKLLTFSDTIYPQFATHNAYSVGAVIASIQTGQDFEFQCLHGMGDTLYDNLVEDKETPYPCRIYAPVGGHENLLAYLVRRLLENGANTSFVNRIVDESAPIEEIIADPVAKTRMTLNKPHPHIPLPNHLYGDERPNSKGIELNDPLDCANFLQSVAVFKDKQWQAKPSVMTTWGENPQPILNPAKTDEKVGQLYMASEAQIQETLSQAEKTLASWEKVPVETRAASLEKMAMLLEENRDELIALLAREAGKTYSDGIAEVREAIDFCWYYAKEARLQFAPKILRGPTGELNQLNLAGRGIIACISPWNFPLAIFIGQVTAALAAGNVVIAKPATQTPLIASFAIDLLHQAGVPQSVVQLLPASGRLVGDKLLPDNRISGVMFTGSTETAQSINQTLANRQGPIVPFIAETGGLNAMIVDSSALPEQVVKDVLLSAFGSAGQRCSSLRALYLQEDIADNLIELLTGAMDELKIGDPLALNTDIGPVIDKSALAMLKAHAQEMESRGKKLAIAKETADCSKGSFFLPRLYEIDRLSTLGKEVFGPILHVIRYKASELDQVIGEINQSGYGLTLGIHSRIDETVDYITQRVKVGNLYVNRNMIGAVVGVQPFGGEGLSGTGPKAGGPHYLARLATERTLSVNTVASGGNTTLLSLKEE